MSCASGKLQGDRAEAESKERLSAIEAWTEARIGSGRRGLLKLGCDTRKPSEDVIFLVDSRCT